MRRLPLIVIAAQLVTACGSSQPAGSTTGSEETPHSEQGASASGGEGGGSEGDNEFRLRSSDSAGDAHGDRPSEIEATATEAAMRLFVVDPETGPIEGIVIKMTGPGGAEYYTQETDSQGYAEVLVPVGQRYVLEYLSLGRRGTTANVDVPAGPNQDIRLTLRHRRNRGQQPSADAAPRFILDGVYFDTGRTTIQAESLPRLDRVVEYMTHMPSARIRVAGHTDNVGNPRTNLALSERRAQAVREYLVSHGIDGGRIEAVGRGDQEPIAPNDTEEGRQQNRRIEAVEL